MGKNTETINESEIKNEIGEPKIKITEKLFPTSFYITEKQRKALKLKIALSDKLEDKDFSSIVRAALNIYLEDVIKDI